MAMAMALDFETLASMHIDVPQMQALSVYRAIASPRISLLCT